LVFWALALTAYTYNVLAVWRLSWAALRAWRHSDWGWLYVVPRHRPHRLYALAPSLTASGGCDGRTGAKPHYSTMNTTTPHCARIALHARASAGR